MARESTAQARLPVPAETVDWRGFRADPGNLPQSAAGVYAITHLETGRIYVGCTDDVARRTSQHGRTDAKTDLSRAIAEHGRAAFLVQPVVYVPTKHGEVIEETLIAAWNTMHPVGFNARETACGSSGPVHSERVRAGLNLARERGQFMGRPRIGPEVEAAIRARLAAGDGILKTAKAVGVGSGTVQRVRREAAEAA